MAVNVSILRGLHYRNQRTANDCTNKWIGTFVAIA